MNNKQKLPLWAKILIGLSILLCIGALSDPTKNKEEKQEEQRIEEKEPSKEFTSQKDVIEKTLDTEKNEQNTGKQEVEDNSVITTIADVRKKLKQGELSLKPKDSHSENENRFTYAVKSDNTFFYALYTVNKNDEVVLANATMKPAEVQEIDALSIVQMALFLKSLDEDFDTGKWVKETTKAILGEQDYPKMKTNKISTTTFSIEGLLHIFVEAVD